MLACRSAAAAVAAAAAKGELLLLLAVSLKRFLVIVFLYVYLATWRLGSFCCRWRYRDGGLCMAASGGRSGVYACTSPFVCICMLSSRLSLLS